MSKKKILITGGKGFIGSRLKDRLASEGNEVSVADLPDVDICSGGLFDAFEKAQPDVVFHLAAQTDVRVSNEQPAKDARVNIMGSLNVLDASRKIGVKKIVFASSAAVYGKAALFPTPEDAVPSHPSPYGMAKAAAENYFAYYLEHFNLPFVALRFANVYGPGQKGVSVVGSFFERVLSGQEVVIHGDGNQTRDFVFVKDIVNGCILAVESDAVGVYNLATGKETSLKELLISIENITGMTARVRFNKNESGGQQRSSLAVKKAKKELQWEPSYTLQQGLEETFEWYKTRRVRIYRLYKSSSEKRKAHQLSRN
ncbi:MAG: NAD-dependent epimerase/dehydratase family protein [Candidatus Wildermuthbacteria bacterium]|nr:NAD-dependent epimerase/dehydratase family protein [Candidatus Wildermuthbacteria bacterium]